MSQTAFEQTVEKALKTGQIGTPVSIRLNLQLPDDGQDLEVVKKWCAKFAQSIFQSDVKSVLSGKNKDEKQNSTITKFENGATLSLTIGKSSILNSQIQFLLIGQNGIIQSDGMENITFD